MFADGSQNRVSCGTRDRTALPGSMPGVLVVGGGDICSRLRASCADCTGRGTDLDQHDDTTRVVELARSWRVVEPGRFDGHTMTQITRRSFLKAAVAGFSAVTFTRPGQAQAQCPSAHWCIESSQPPRRFECRSNRPVAVCMHTAVVYALPGDVVNFNTRAVKAYGFLSKPSSLYFPRGVKIFHQGVGWVS